jgi:hypothetical protein
MASNMETTPEQARQALVRHIAAKLVVGEQGLRQRTESLSIAEIVSCLEICPERTRRRLDQMLDGLTPERVEERTATHDGHIWPTERRNMVQISAIVERMAQDFLALSRKDGLDNWYEELQSLGWTGIHLDSHAHAARNRAQLLQAELA